MAGREGDLSSQRHGPPGGERVRLLLAEDSQQLPYLVEVAGRKAGLGGRKQPIGAPVGVGGQDDRAPEERGRRRDPTPGPGLSGRSLQFGGDLLVRHGRGRGEVPGATVGGVLPVGYLGQGQVSGPALGRCRRPVDGRPNERVAEGNPFGDREEPVQVIEHRRSERFSSRSRIEQRDRVIPDSARVTTRRRGRAWTPNHCPERSRWLLAPAVASAPPPADAWPLRARWWPW
uniref:hypothetical protein n=1 Tax=Paractinoplanes polyasparticus TaxID=2856853 RepID=UPI002103D71A|nr:hypothetical protein [Actinoplanes polyasparticus]